MTEKVYTIDKWKKVNKCNKGLLEDYLIELKSKRRKQSTLDQYLCDGKMVLCYILYALENKSVLEFTKKDFRKVALWLTEERQVSNARFNRVFAIVRGMMEYAEDEDDYEYEKNVVRKIKNLPKEPVKENVFLTDAQIQKLRNYLLEHERYRECTYLDISYDSAGRVNEIWQVNKENLLRRRFTNTVIGKRGKPFKLLYHFNSLESLKLYLNARGEDDIDSLWIKFGKDMRQEVTKAALYGWAKKMAKILSEIEGKKINFSPHSLRHTSLENYKNGTHYMCAKLGKPEGFKIEELQVLAHHDSMDTTKGYLKPNDNNILEQMFGIKLE